MAEWTKTTTDKGHPRCQGTVTDPGGWRVYQCSFRARYSDDRYCGNHDPDQEKARAAKRPPTQWERECAARAKQRERIALLEAVAEAAWQINTAAHGDEDRDTLDAALTAWKNFE